MFNAQHLIGNACADRSQRGRLRLTGRDRQSFLQGMVTNDVARLTPGQGCYAFLLDATGHVLADARILCTSDSLWLDVEPGLATFVAETLDKYLIMERCKITDVTETTAQILLAGEQAIELLQNWGVPEMSDSTEGQNAEFADGILVARTHLLPVSSFDLYLRVERKAELLTKLSEANIYTVTDDVLEALRIEAGVPRFGVDIDSRVLAPETGQQKRAISYKKGCYIGQEIVARIDARGHTNRELTQFELLEPTLPAPETPIRAGGKEVGRVTSAAIGPISGKPFALGYIRHEYRAEGNPVLLGDIPAQRTPEEKSQVMRQPG